MPYYKEKNILFIHIPKTGGTVIENQLKYIYKQTLFNVNRDSNLLDPPYNTINYQHQFYTTLYKYRNKLDIDFNNNDIKIFSVVRNPYDRVISDLFFMLSMKKNTPSDEVYNIIKYNYLYRNDLDNHNEPQYKYLVDENSELIKNIKIFKTETLNESNDILNKYLGVDINIKKTTPNMDYSIYLNNDSIALINEFYKKDFELFGYDLR